MKDEHFGITIIEFLVNSVISVVNNSGGPRDDLITCKEVGFTCSTDEEYQHAILQIHSKSEDSILQMQEFGKKFASKFSDEEFNRKFILYYNSVAKSK